MQISNRKTQFYIKGTIRARQEAGHDYYGNPRPILIIDKWNSGDLEAFRADMGFALCNPSDWSGRELYFKCKDGTRSSLCMRWIIDWSADKPDDFDR